jgi:hypothetical protein
MRSCANLAGCSARRQFASRLPIAEPTATLPVLKKIRALSILLTDPEA